MKKDKEYLSVTLPQRLVVPKELLGKLMDILAQCGSQEWVYRSGAAPSLYFARPLSMETQMECKVRHDVYALTSQQFSKYSDAIKETTGDEIMSAEEWLKLTGN